MKIRLFLVTIFSIAILQGCGPYSFTGISINPDVKTFQVSYFQNNAVLVEPGIDRDFTFALQELILNQTSLDLVTSNGDLVYEGEIVQYYIAPITATAQNTAAQNRLTISINLRYINTKNEEDDLEQRFSFYFDYDGAAQLAGSQLDDAITEIYDRITQDMFNATLAKW